METYEELTLENLTLFLLVLDVFKSQGRVSNVHTRPNFFEFLHVNFLLLVLPFLLKDHICNGAGLIHCNL